MLRAGENELGGGERACGLTRLRRDPIGVERHESGADRERRPYARFVERRQVEPSASDPGQRQAEAQERGRRHEREGEQAERPRQRQRRRRNRDRGEQEDDEGVGDPSGKEEEDGELENVVGEEDGRVALAEPGAERDSASAARG